MKSISHIYVIFEVVAMEAMWFSLTLIILLIVQVSQKVQEALTERAASFGLILDDISLVRAYVNVVQEFMLNKTHTLYTVGP